MFIKKIFYVNLKESTNAFAKHCKNRWSEIEIWVKINNKIIRNKAIKKDNYWRAYLVILESVHNSVIA